MEERQRSAEVVLVVDGDILVRHAISDYLRHCGYVVIEAASTDEAHVVIGERGLRIDAVLCDADAPGSRSAFQFRAWAKAHLHDVQIALAGNIETAAAKAADLCEEGPHLARPYDPQSVVRHVKQLIAKAAPGKGSP